MTDDKLDGRVLDALYALIESRRGTDPKVSYSAGLLAEGPRRIARKLGEEATETVIEGVSGGTDRLAAESADLLYHLLVLWAARGLTPGEVWAALEARSGRSGLKEKASRRED